MPAKNGFELQPSDIELLHFVYQLRIATVHQLAALSGRSIRSLWGRLFKLKEHRYLAIAPRFIPNPCTKATPILSLIPWRPTTATLTKSWVRSIPRKPPANGSVAPS